MCRVAGDDDPGRPRRVQPGDTGQHRRQRGLASTGQCALPVGDLRHIPDDSRHVFLVTADRQCDDQFVVKVDRREWAHPPQHADQWLRHRHRIDQNAALGASSER